MGALLVELRAAARRLRHSRGFAAAAVLTLALGIGANTALFSVANAVLLRPLPFPHAERLVTVWEREKDGTETNTGYPTFRDWAERGRSLESAAAAGYWVPTLTGAGTPERLEGLKVSASFFGTLGVRPALGRDFAPEEDRPGADRAVLVSWGLWQRRFGGDPALAGRLLTLDGVPHTVVGVLPRSFPALLSTNHAPSPDVFKPLGYDATMPQACRSCRHLWVLGRLRPGIEREAAERELSSVMQQIAREHPADYATVGTIVKPLKEHLTGESRPVLVAVVAAAAFLLGLACVNLAGLHLARGLERRPDVALRAALGASRGRLAAHVLGESLLLGLLGGGLGVLVAGWGVALLRSLAPSWVPRLGEASVDGPALAFALAVSVACGLALGAVPALRAAAADPQEWLRESARHGAGPARQRGQRLLLAGQVAIAAILLVGAVLSVKSLGRLLDVEAGLRGARPRHRRGGRALHRQGARGPLLREPRGDARVGSRRDGRRRGQPGAARRQLRHVGRPRRGPECAEPRRRSLGRLLRGHAGLPAGDGDPARRRPRLRRAGRPRGAGGRPRERVARAPLLARGGPARPPAQARRDGRPVAGGRRCRRRRTPPRPRGAPPAAGVRAARRRSRRR